MKLEKQQEQPSSELQQLLEQFGLQDQSTPASVWNFAGGNSDHSDNDAVINNAGKNVGPETVTVRTTDLQQLLSNINQDDFSVPASGVWDKKQHLNQIKSSEISSGGDEIDLKSLITTTPAPKVKLNNMDVIKLKNMKNQISNLREKQEENMASKDQLQVHDFKLLNKLIVKENKLQQLLNNLDTSDRIDIFLMP